MTESERIFERAAEQGIVMLCDGDVVRVAPAEMAEWAMRDGVRLLHAALDERHVELDRAVRAAHRAIERARQTREADHGR